MIPFAIATAGLLVMIPAILPQNGRVVCTARLGGAGDLRFVALVSLISVAVLRPIITRLLCCPLSTALPALQLAATSPWRVFLMDALMRTRRWATGSKAGSKPGCSCMNLQMRLDPRFNLDKPT